MPEPLYVVTSSGNRRRSRKLNRGPLKRLRFEVFTRDQFTCQADGCGRKAVPPDGWDGTYSLWTEGGPGRGGKVLHLDHVIPYSAGGTETADNMRVLCEPCNLSRGDRT